MIVSIWECPASINFNSLVWKECRINTSIGYSHIYPQVIFLLTTKKIDVRPLITKKIELKDIVKEGFETLLV